MPRAKIGAARTRRRNRILRQARGYYGSRSRHFQRAKEAVIRSGCYAYRDRRNRKRDFRRLWITRINAACRMRNARYSQFINGLRLAGVNLNRKMLSQLAIEDPKVFDQLVETSLKATTAVPAKA